MNRDKFFEMLLFYLKQLPQEEGFKIATFFSDMIEDSIEDGISEHDAVKALGNPEEIAVYILQNAYGITPDVGVYVPVQITHPTTVAPKADIAPPPENKEEILPDGSKIYTPGADNISQINISLKNFDLDISPSEDDKIHIKYIENERTATAITENDGILDFSLTDASNDGFPLKGLFGGKKKDATPIIVLQLPAKYNRNIYTACEGCAIKIQGITNINHIDCTTKNASIRIIDTNAVILSAKTTNHRITVTKVNVEKDLTVNTSNASIDVNKTKAESVSCKTSGSEITLAGVEVKNMIQALTSGAYIEIKEVIGNYIDLRTSGGKISGTVIGNINDYSITSKSTGGKSNLPNIPFGVKRLSAITSKEGINITFKDAN